MKKFFTIRIEPEMLKELSKIAKHLDRPIGYLIRKFIEQGIKSFKKE